ncbi:hypothetical protein FB45DRAFT_1065926 [Roridomyces roridus]|uniref:F-box domain-containing protein n=1 Tax=Roridomyces roridus TaxID=1738132 RepID=A0AAD7B677_9AGAR|nr:hypothetical protein FB45DRAFT_1065926 [Roridomyces roridus]
MSDYAPDFTILETLPRKLPGLKNVSVCGAAPDLSISTFVCTLHDLETLVVPCLDLKAFNHLCRLPRLRYLWVMSTAPPRVPPRPRDLPCFPALRIFECESIEAAPNLLGQTGRSLVEFSLFARRWRTYPTKQLFRELYAALASNCTHTLLEKISMGSDDLRTLFCFRNLVHVWLNHTVAVDMDDAVALDMARAWPCIELLAFPCDAAHRITPRMTFDGVYAFAEHCPLLRYLCLLFDATDVPKLQLAPEGNKHRRVSQNTLRYFVVEYSPIGGQRKEWQRVANFLRSIFPALYHIEATKPDSSADSDAQASAAYRAWMKVSDKFP